MNNKGFAITGILYGILLLFLAVLASLLAVLSTRINRLFTLTEEVNASIENKNTININTTITDYYITEYRGKYTFNVNGSTCTSYLPSNILLRINNNKLQYLTPTLTEGNYVLNTSTTEGLTNVTFTETNCNNLNVTSVTVSNVNTSYGNNQE